MASIDQVDYNQTMSGKHQLFIKIILAQLVAFFVSSFFVQKIFLGPVPIVRTEVKDTIHSLPATVIATVKNLGRNQLPPPWVDKSAPIHEGNVQFPTAIAQNPINPPNGEQPKPYPTLISKNTPPQSFTTLFPTLIPIYKPQPTAAANRPRPTEQSVPTVSPPPPPPANTASLETQTIAEINRRRKNDGLQALAVNAQLTAAARRHSVDISRRGVCGHTGSDGSDPFKRALEAGFNGRVYGETVSCRARTPEQAVGGWWSSPPHHAILINSGIRQIGLGWVNNYQTALVGY